MSFEVWASGIMALGAGAAIVGALAYRKGRQAATHDKVAAEDAPGTGDTPMGQQPHAATGSDADGHAGAALRDIGLEAPDSPTAAGAMVQDDIDETPVSCNTELATVSADEPQPQAEDEQGLDVDMAQLGTQLHTSPDAMGELRRLVGRIRKAQKAAGEGQGPEPTQIASYLARGLEEAGLLDEDAHLSGVAVVVPSHSKTFYLRVEKKTFAWPDMLRVLAIESALNRALFAWERRQQLDRQAGQDASTDSAGDRQDGKCDARLAEPFTLEDCYRFNQSLAASVTAQLGHETIGHATMFDVHGEWGVRQAISAGIESLRTPQRLSAQFRLNLMGGDAAIVSKFVPWQAMPASVWSDDLGRIVAASALMRKQEASRAAMRQALLLASHAFRCSRRLCHVFVSVVLDSPTTHKCLLWGDISREALAEMDLTGSYDPVRACQDLGVVMRLRDGALTEVTQGFSLDSERFCPSSRYEPVGLSRRLLPSFEAELLGAERVSDLAINEHDHRQLVAQRIASRLGASTKDNVRAILSLTDADKDPSVRQAGLRVAEKLIEGTLSETDSLSFADEFVNGDELTRACDEALGLLKRGNATKAVDVLTDALAPIDALDTYADNDEVVWREFSSYVGRTLYNRVHADDTRRVCLVPDSYYNAQLIMASALMATGRIGQALGFARRCQELDEFDMAGTLRAVRCLEVLGRRHEAAQELRGQLERAYDPESLGVCYYRLAYFEWRLGNIDAADACYQKAAVSRASCSGTAVVELQMMRHAAGSDGLDPHDVEDALEQAQIPSAPTAKVLEIVVEAAQAATDAEVFPVARSFASLLGALTGDDVMAGVIGSFEHEPDR